LEIRKSTLDSPYRLSPCGETTSDADENTPSCTYWTRDDGRAFLTDPNGEVANIARLTAYAEYGEEIHDAQAYHEIDKYKIDAPRFLDAVSKKEHSEFHCQGPERIVIDGFQLLRVEK